MTPDLPTKPGERFAYLDSLRGLCVILVMAAHCWRMNPDYIQSIHHDPALAMDSVKNFFLYGIARLYEISRSAVMAFFTLSGFVLAHSLLGKQTAYGAYIIKRFFRLYPALIVALLVSFFLHTLIGFHHSVNSEWLGQESNPDLSLSTLLKNIALWSTWGSNGLDRIVWSLVHEVRISLIFPLILFTVYRFRIWALIGYGMVSLASTFYLFHLTGHIAIGYEEQNFALTLLDTAYYIVFFACGAFLAIERERITQKFSRMPIWLTIILLGLIIFCWAKDEYDFSTISGCLNDYIRGIASWLLIALLLSQKYLKVIFNHAVMIWLGRISYSLYLVHCIVLYVISQTIGMDWPIWQSTLAIFAVSLAIAEILARLIEFPAIRLGKKLTQNS